MTACGGFGRRRPEEGGGVRRGGRRGSVWALAAAALALCLGTGPAALAQSSMSVGLYFGELQPSMSRSDLDVFRRVLELQEAEVEAMHALHEAYSTTFLGEGAAVRRYCAGVIEEAEVMGDQGLLAPAHERLGEWRKRQKALEDQFVSDLRSLLTREQEARWPLVERELRRLKTMSRGRLAGESVDVIRLLQQTRPSAEGVAEVAESLEQYSQSLDRALLERNGFLDEHGDGYHELVRSDPDRARELYERSRALRIRVRDVNERAVRQVAQYLDPDAAEALEWAYFQKAYGTMAEPTRGEKYILASLELTTLSAAQREQLAPVVNGYERRKRDLLRRMAAVKRGLDETVLPPQLEPGAAGDPEAGYFRAQGLPEGHPMRALRQERWELDRETRQRIDAVLTPHQRAAIPEATDGVVRFVDDRPWAAL